MTGQHLCDFCSQICGYYQELIPFSAEVSDIASGGLAVCSVHLPKVGIFWCFLSTLKPLQHQIRVQGKRKSTLL